MQSGLLTCNVASRVGTGPAGEVHNLAIRAPHYAPTRAPAMAPPALESERQLLESADHAPESALVFDEPHDLAAEGAASPHSCRE